MLDPADLARSRPIAATGTIDLDGQVGAVGGVPEKAVAAERAGAEVLVVPAADTGDIDEPGLDVRRVDDPAEALRVIEAT